MRYACVHGSHTYDPARRMGPALGRNDTFTHPVAQAETPQLAGYEWYTFETSYDDYVIIIRAHRLMPYYNDEVERAATVRLDRCRVGAQGTGG